MWKLFVSDSKKEIARLSEEVKFWRERAESVESDLKKEKLRNQKREDLLLDRVLVSRGSFPIAKEVEKHGFETPLVSDKTEMEILESEKQAFLNDCLQRQIPKEQAELYWTENNAQILANVV